MRGVRYLSHLPGTGQGDAAEEYIAGLRARAPVSWTPLVWGRGTWEPDLAPAGPAAPGARRYRHDDIRNRPIEHDITVVHSTPLWPDGLSHARHGGRLIAYTAFEADRIPQQWVRILNRYDAVIVPSAQNVEAFRGSGVRVPVHAVPHAVRPPDPASQTTDLTIPDDLFIFYVIGTWTSRKALPDTIRAFLRAFTSTDGVALVVKTSAEDRVALYRRWQGREVEPGPGSGQTWWSLARLLAGHPDTAPIRLITRDVPRSAIDALHAQGDCFVSLSRGEGWGLGAFEAAAAGNPVVVPGWGGQLDFLPADYPYLVRHDMVPTTDDEPDDWFETAQDQRWAKADVAHAAELLRNIHQHRTQARAWGARLSQRIVTDFDRDRVTDRLVAALLPR